MFTTQANPVKILPSPFKFGRRASRVPSKRIILVLQILKQEEETMSRLAFLTKPRHQTQRWFREFHRQRVPDKLVPGGTTVNKSTDCREACKESSDNKDISAEPKETQGMASKLSLGRFVCNGTFRRDAVSSQPTEKSSDVAMCCLEHCMGFAGQEV